MGEHTRRDTTLVVIYVIGAVLLAAVLLIGLLAFKGQPIPDVLQNVAVGSLTGLVGLLVKPPASL